MAKGKAPSPQAKSEVPADVRRAVLNAALQIIAEEGPDAVSMREVARRAGVSHQAPYHYFGDRAGIFAAISEEGFTQFAQAFESSLQSRDPLVDCLHTYVLFAIEHKGHYRVMFRQDICGVPTHEHTRAAADRAFLALLDLANLVDPNNSQSAHPLVLPTTLWAHAHGLATLLIDGPLLAKLPPGTDIDSFTQQVGLFASRSIRDQIKN